MKQKPLSDDQTRYDKDGRRLCDAKQNTCRAKAVKDRRKCYHHGGATPRGRASANFRHGAYSQYTKAEQTA
jgi:hypothetical protein